MLVLHALILLRDENYLSHSQLVIRKAPNIFKAKNIFGKAKTSTLIRVADIKTGRSFLYFTSSLMLYQRYKPMVKPK